MSTKMMQLAMNGYYVRVSADFPKMQLSIDCPVTPEFRDETNAWMIRFFGMDNLIPDGEVFIMETLRIIQMNPRTYARLERDLDAAGLKVPANQLEFPMLL